MVLTHLQGINRYLNRHLKYHHYIYLLMIYLITKNKPKSFPFIVK